MSFYVVTAVRRDPNTGEVTHVRWGMADPQTNVWSAELVEAPVPQVVDAIEAGATVTTRHPEGIGHVAGRDVQVSVLIDGRKVLRSESAQDSVIRGIEDLPEF